MSLEEEQRATRDEIKALRSAIEGLASTVVELRDELKPRFLDRGSLGEMLGITQANLRTHLSRKNAQGKLSPLGETLLRLAVVGLDGRQAWRPEHITAHCKPWLGRGVDQDDDR